MGRIALHHLYSTMRANLYREPKFCGSSSATCACGSHKISLYELPTKLLMQPMIHEYAIAFNAKVTMIDMRPQSSRVLVRRRRRSENTKLPSFALLSALCASCVQARHSGSTILTLVRGSGLGRTNCRSRISGCDCRTALRGSIALDYVDQQRKHSTRLDSKHRLTIFDQES